jgi:hypothetical protein
MARLTERTISRIAAQYGLSASDHLVVVNAEQAQTYHGTQAASPNWGTDIYGVYQADLLLGGYLAEETRVMRAYAASHRDFCRNAY